MKASRINLRPDTRVVRGVLSDSAAHVAFPQPEQLHIPSEFHAAQQVLPAYRQMTSLLAALADWEQVLATDTRPDQPRLGLRDDMDVGLQFNGSGYPECNDIGSLPCLLPMIAGLPIYPTLGAVEEDARFLAPFVSGLLPEFGVRDVLLKQEQIDDERAATIIDKLYEIAALHDHHALWTLADRTLFHLTIMRGAKSLLSRLVERFQLCTETITRRSGPIKLISTIARRRLGCILLLAQQDEAARELLGVGETLSWSHPAQKDYAFKSFVQNVDDGAQNFLELVRVYLNRHMDEVEALHPELLVIWDDYDTSRIVANRQKVHLGESASQKRFREDTELLELLNRKLQRLLGFWIHDEIDGQYDERCDLSAWIAGHKTYHSIRSLKKLSACQLNDAYHMVSRDLRKAEPMGADDAWPDDLETSAVAETAEDQSSSYGVDHDDDRLPRIQDRKRSSANTLTKAVSASEDAGQIEDSVKHSLVVLEAMPERGRSDNRNIYKNIEDKLIGKPLALVKTTGLKPVRDHLNGMLPHLATVTDRILNAVAPHATVKLPPILLVGDPGSGKTTLAEELAKALQLPSITIDAAGTGDANFLGVDGRWNTGAQGVHLDLFLEHEIANPVIVIDELEKLGGSKQNGDARSKLLGLLEPRRSASFFDPFLATPINASRLNWIFTANSLEGISAPLQNRLEIIHCPNPTVDHLPQLANQVLIAECENRGLHPAWAEPLTPEELGILSEYWPGAGANQSGGSIRNLRKYVRSILDARDWQMSSV